MAKQTLRSLSAKMDKARAAYREALLSHAPAATLRPLAAKQQKAEDAVSKALGLYVPRGRQTRHAPGWKDYTEPTTDPS